MTRDEVTAFREVFQIAQSDEENAAKVFNLARQDVAGFRGIRHAHQGHVRGRGRCAYMT